VSKRILAADIGGTNARFALLSRDDGTFWNTEAFQKFKGDDYRTFQDVLSDYLNGLEAQPDCAVFSVAGPISGHKVSLTNRDWHLDTKTLSQKFGFSDCILINDFTAMTRSVPELREDDFLPVKEGLKNTQEPILVAGPGTGFGVGYLVPTQSNWQVMTTEGGHQAYSPQSEREMELLRLLQKHSGYVSLERVAAGIGLPDVHKAICERLGKTYSPLSPAIIREKAKSGDPVSLEICEIRANAVMGALGDLALSGGTRGGIVMAGGVSERMLEFLTAESAMQRFLERGDYTKYMEDIEIRLLTHPHAALIGAAAYFEDYTQAI